MKPHETTTNYVLTSCSGKFQRSGRNIHELVVTSLDGENSIDMPTIIECDEIPEVREEIPTPDVALHYEHLHDIAVHIPPIDPNAKIMLLIEKMLLRQITSWISASDSAINPTPRNCHLAGQSLTRLVWVKPTNRKSLTL